MSVSIKSGATSDVMTVDPTSNAARMSLYDSTGQNLAYAHSDQPTTPRGIMAMGLNDESVHPIRLDRIGSLASATHTMLLQDSFESTVTNPMRWLVTSTTMSATQTTISGLLFNSGAITTVNTGYMLKSSAIFMKCQKSPLQAKFRARLNHYNNSVMELGFGDAATFNGANTTGAYWQMTASGVLQPVVTFNSVDITGTDIRSSISTSNYYTFDVIMDDDEANFICQDTSTGLIISDQSIKLPLTGGRLLSSTQIPVMARLYNTGVAPATAPQMSLTDVYVLALDNFQNKPWSTVLACNYRAAPNHPFTGAQLPSYANSAAATSATMSNTTPSYTTLGGLWQFAARTGAATDYALFGFTVPTNSNLVVTGIDIESYNTGAAVVTTPTLLLWSCAVGATAGSLTTAPISRMTLGVQSFPVGAVVGASAQRISKIYSTPLVVPSGRFFHIILRMPVGTNTASQVIAGMVTIDGYFE